jgi:hypothetical protein
LSRVSVATIPTYRNRSREMVERMFARTALLAAVVAAPPWAGTPSPVVPPASSNPAPDTAATGCSPTCSSFRRNAWAYSDFSRETWSGNRSTTISAFRP